MKRYNKDIGKYGEALAYDYLIKKKYKIINKNFQNRYGEIDIIAIKNFVIHFIEVKCRYNKDYGFALDAVNFYKQMKIKKLAKYFINSFNLYQYNIQFDVCEVYLNYYNDNFRINFIENAFA